MSYQVLARKWRPKNFQELIGQEHVVNVLVNALTQKRLHHAYLFTGTRGVGKTTIARIFAKSLNCEIGITDQPCGQCDACLDIDQGRFVDLLEIDAASKTKVDDTREILDNVQYAPSRGRFKVYLIDEVHMLSRHSFNALLKTLEEPPEHVKFILATTDPQKLPVTVLSRCLQFHLKALTVRQIESKLSDILLSERVTHEPGCITLLAKAARGSMRDSLSLTDQAIAQGQGNLSLAHIQQMLGGIDQHWVYQLVNALVKQDSKSLMALSQEIASYAPSYSRLFAELIQLFHQIALIQIVDQNFDLPADLLALLKRFSQVISAEDVQLYYQISLNGRKDLPYASDEQAAFDMTLLRLLAFRPMEKSQLSDDFADSQAAVLDTAVKNTIPAEPSHNSSVGDNSSVGVNNSSVGVSRVDNSQVDAQLASSTSSSQVSHANNLNQNEAMPSSVASDSPPLKHLSSNQAEVSQEEANTLGQVIVEPVNNGNTENAEQQFPEISPNDTGSHNNAEYAQWEQHNALSEQMFSIEQQASQLLGDEVQSVDSIIDADSAANTQVSTGNNYTQARVDNVLDQGSTSAMPVSPLSDGQSNLAPAAANNRNDTAILNSPVTSVLATRNMLRSRKKELEQGTKKSSDAAMRHIPQSNQVSDENSNATNTAAEHVHNVEAQVNNSSRPEESAPTSQEASPIIPPEPDVPFHQDSIDPTKVTKANQVDKWAHMIDSMQLTARVRQLAIHATISEESTDDNLVLQLDQSTRHLNTEFAQKQLQTTICNFLSKDVTVTLNVVEKTVADPYQIQVQINDKRLDYAKTLIKQDDVVIALQNTFQARLHEETISAR